MFLGIFYPVELDVNWADEFLYGRKDKRTSASSSIDIILARRN